MERSEVVGVRVSPREKRMFERLAKKNHMTVSDYLRAGAMLSAMFDGDKEAIAITAGLVKEKFGDQLQLAWKAVGVPGVA